MKKNFITAAFCVALAAWGISASAQTKYTEGIVTYKATLMGNTGETKTYFTPDSSATTFQMGAANIKTVASKDFSAFTVLVDIPAMNKKIAGVATPSEIEEIISKFPKFTYTKTTETKVISKFNCKKVVAKDVNSGKSYDIWITNDINLPESVAVKYYAGLDGFPIDFTAFQQGMEIHNTVTGITEGKQAKGFYSVPADYDKITLTELNAMSGR